MEASKLTATEMAAALKRGETTAVRLIEACPSCGHLRYSACTNPGRLIDPGKWDGSDFFMVWPLPAYVFITERVALMIQENDLSGGVLKQVGKLVFSSGIGSGFSPGRLSYHMPEQRARELGQPLDIY